MSASPMMNYEEAAAFLGLKVNTLYSMVSRKELPHVRLSRRLVRFDRAELARWVAERRVAPAERAT